MFLKLQRFANRPVLKKTLAICMCMLICGAMLIPAAFAADGITTDMTPEEAATDIFGRLYQLITVQMIVSVIGIALAASVGIFLAWWAIRKVTRMVIQAFSKGKISV